MSSLPLESVAASRRAFLFVLAALAASASKETRAAAPPDPKSPLANLRTGHPRLSVTDTDLAQVKRLLATDATAQKYLASLRAAGEKILPQPTVEYKLEGPRLLTQSRRCLGRIEMLGALYRLDGDMKWADRAKKELLAAAAFPDWNPSHFLDVAELTHAFALGYDWLYPTFSDTERKTIREAIVNKGLRRGEEAYKGTQQWKWWTTVHHNWNQVCNAGMVLGALAVADEEPELAHFIVTSALKSLPLAMASFAPDGGWNEGPGYWSYTVKYTVALLAGLQSALETDFGLATAGGFDRTGTFRLYYTGPFGKVFNYSDAGDESGGAPWLRWLARRFNQPLYDWEATRGMGDNPGPYDLLWYRPVTVTPKSARIPLDNVWRGVDAAFFRSAWEDRNALFVGFKGGDNTANHAHLDLGTFVFDSLGERWAVALGGDNYNLPNYFGKDRWNYYRLRTEGHNTVLINGANQDTKAKAPLLAFASTARESYAVADLTAGYKAAGASRVWRGVGLVQGRQSLVVQDEITASAPVEYVWTMHTPAQVVADGTQATLTLHGKTCVAQLVAPSGATFAATDATPSPLNGGVGPQQNPNKGISKLMVHLPGKVTEARIMVVLTPLAPGKTPPHIGVGDAKPLSEWIKKAPPLPALGGNLGTPST